MIRTLHRQRLEAVLAASHTSEATISSAPARTRATQAPRVPAPLKRAPYTPSQRCSVSCRNLSCGEPTCGSMKAAPEISTDASRSRWRVGHLRLLQQQHHLRLVPELSI